MKRYCQTLTLVDDEAMIKKYVEAHSHVWSEVIQGQREVGILDMQIYRCGRSLFMIMDTKDDFDFTHDMARLDSLPKQAEWEAYVSQFQGAKDRVLADILNPEFGAEGPQQLISRLVYMYRRWQGNAWKQKLCYNESRMESFMDGIKVKLTKPSAE